MSQSLVPETETERQRTEREVPPVSSPARATPQVPSRGQNVMGVRAAQQMEEKGSIYSPDYGRPRAEREQRQSLRDIAKGLERTDEDVQNARRRLSTAVESSRDRQDADEGSTRRTAVSQRRQAEAEAEARGRESDTRERERQAQEERDRRIAAARRRQAESRSEVESNRERQDTEEGSARRMAAQRSLERAKGIGYISGSEGEDRGPTTKQIEDRQRAQGLQGVYPETLLLAPLGRGLGTAAAAAKRGVEEIVNRRNEIQDTAARIFSRPQARESRESEAMKAARERREAAVRAAQERRRAAAEARRNRDTSRMEGESLGPVTPRTNPRREPPPPRDLDELRMSGEGFGFKKGGKLKFASGGKVGASRGDGIAQRGRTRGKYL